VNRIFGAIPTLKHLRKGGAHPNLKQLTLNNLNKNDFPYLKPTRETHNL